MYVCMYVCMYVYLFGNLKLDFLNIEYLKSS